MLLILNNIFLQLDYKVDEKKLREIFKLAGRVMDIELYTDKEGKSRGCAVIDFDHPVESVQAISMFHDQLLYERMMTVRMDRMDDASIRLPEGLKGIGMGLGPNGEPLRSVSQHLRSTNSSVSDINMGGNSGAGILGAMPNAGLQNIGSALSNVVNTPALAGLASAAGALQGLTGVQNQFLASNLNELGLSNLNPSLVANTLGGNAFSALASANLGNQHISSNMSSSNMSGGGNMSSSNLMGQSSGMHSYNRGDNSNAYHLGNQGRDFNSGNRDYDQLSGRSNYDKSDNDYQNDFRQQQNNPLYSTVNNGSQRNSVGNMGNMGNKDTKYTSDTVIVTNVSIKISLITCIFEIFYCYYLYPITDRHM